MREARTTDGGAIVLQGFRQGGGINLPYVFVATLDPSGTPISEVTLGVGQAHELSEFLRQEAEFAKSERKEQV